MDPLEVQVSASVLSLVLTLVQGAATVSSLLGAVYLICRGKEGWGWLLFLAFLFYPH